MEALLRLLEGRHHHHRHRAARPVALLDARASTAASCSCSSTAIAATTAAAAAADAAVASAADAASRAAAARSATARSAATASRAAAATARAATASRAAASRAAGADRTTGTSRRGLALPCGWLDRRADGRPVAQAALGRRGRVEAGGRVPPHDGLLRRLEQLLHVR